MLGQGVLSFLERCPYLEVKVYRYDRNWDRWFCPLFGGQKFG